MQGNQGDEMEFQQFLEQYCNEIEAQQFLEQYCDEMQYQQMQF